MYEEEQQLFGARAGNIAQIDLSIEFDYISNYWAICMEVRAEMRRDPMRIVVNGPYTQSMGPVLGFLNPILHQCHYITADTARVKMWRIADKIGAEGYEYVIRHCGRRPW